MIIYVGDLHLQKKEPFKKAFSYFFDWLLEDSSLHNENNTLVLLGDLTDKSIIAGELNFLLMKLFQNLKFKHTYICRGNHPIHSQTGDATKILDIFDHVTVIRTPTKVTIEKEKFLFLPYYYSSMEGLPPMREYYNNLPDELSKDSYDEVVYHCEDEFNTAFQSNPINLGYLDTKRRIGGHIHKRNKHFLGTPYITRYDEKGKDSFIKTYDPTTKEENFIQIPKIIDYYSVTYGEDLPKVDCIYPIFDIKNSPTNNIRDIQEKYNNIDVREIVKEQFMDIVNSSEIGDKEEKDIEKLFNTFVDATITEEEYLKPYIKKLGVN